jgi:LacI family transcriptional regulator
MNKKEGLEKPAARTRPATVIDVAKRAGVSPMTVSRVINSEGGVSPATRLIVAEAIRELNYSPNVAARSLVTAREVKIGVVYSNPSAAFMTELLTGVFEEASVKGAQITLARGEDGGPPGKKDIERLIGSGVRGVILAPPLGEKASVIELLKTASLPMAVVAGVSHDAISVRINDRRAAYEMTKHLLALGHRRIGFVLGNPDQSATAERLSGFQKAIREAGDAETIIVQGDFSYASGLAAGELLLDAAIPPTAVFASNDDMASAVVSVAHRRRLLVPEDLTVVGFDDTTAAVTLWPPLTTIHQPVRELAAQALKLLTSEIKGRSAAAEGAHHARILKHSLVERQSTAPPKAA